MISSCKKDISGCTDPAALNFNSEANADDGSCITIGKPYMGGYLAYVLHQGDPGYDPNVFHGLIAAPYDQSTGIQWYNGSYFDTGVTNSAIGAGTSNTSALVDTLGNGSYAAKLCYDLVLNGYDDWVLPTRNEMLKIRDNKSQIGGFAVANYWTSTQYDTWHGSVVEFGNWIADLGYYNSASLFPVRAIRYF